MLQLLPFSVVLCCVVVIFYSHSDLWYTAAIDSIYEEMRQIFTAGNLVGDEINRCYLFVENAVHSFGEF